MTVVVDTSVLSLAFRRRDLSLLSEYEQKLASAARRLTLLRVTMLIGMVRQETLTGVKNQKQFEQLRTILDGFVYLPTEQADHDAAAESFNQCRVKGVAVGDIDMLVCAVALRRNAPILTADKNFEHYSRILPITIYDPA